MKHLFIKLNTQVIRKILVSIFFIVILSIENSFGNEELLKVIFPQEEILSNGKIKGKKISRIKSGDGFIEIFKVFKDQVDKNSIHVVTETWTPSNVCHACTASMGYVKLEKTEGGYEIKIPHQIFSSKEGKWGRVVKERMQLDLIGPHTYGLVMTGEDMHQGIISRYVRVFTLPKDGIPIYLDSFFLEPCVLADVKISFDTVSSAKSSYFDLLMVGKVKKSRKRTLRWKWEEGFVEQGQK